MKPFALRWAEWLLTCLAAYVLALQVVFVGRHFDASARGGSALEEYRPNPRSALGFVAQVPFYFLGIVAGLAGVFSDALRKFFPEETHLFVFLALWMGLGWWWTLPGLADSWVLSETTAVALAVFAMFDYFSRVFTWTDHANHVVSVAMSPLLDLPLMIVLVVCVVGAGVMVWKRNPVVWRALRALTLGAFLAAPYLFTASVAWPWEIWRQTLEELLREAVPPSVVAPFHWGQEPSRLAGFTLCAVTLASLVRIAVYESKWLHFSSVSSRAWVAAHFGGLFLGTFLVSGGRHFLPPVS